MQINRITELQQFIAAEKAERLADIIRCRESGDKETEMLYTGEFMAFGFVEMKLKEFLSEGSTEGGDKEAL